MEGAPLELVEGHVHTAWDGAFTSICEVWPPPRAGYWHVWLRGPQTGRRWNRCRPTWSPQLLEEWEFSATQRRNWPVKPQPINPGLRPQLVISPPAGPKPNHSYGS
jgi:hypothetical protein